MQKQQQQRCCFQNRWNWNERLLLLILTLQLVRGTAGIGINIGRMADNLPSAAAIATLVNSQGIDRVKIYDADPDTLRAFAGSNVELAIMVSNEDIPKVSGSGEAAAAWVAANVSAYLAATKITTVMVGNEVLIRADASLAPLLVPAMKNIRAALVAAGATAVAVTTPHAFDVLELSSPPSSGAFRSSLQPVLSAMADELSATASPFMIDVYPYFAFRDDLNVPLDYALFGSSAAGADDPATGLHYSNLFDAQLDAVIAALQRLSSTAAGLPLVVSETGWPSAGDASERGASLDNALTYNQRLVDHVSQRPPKGTPMKPGVNVEVYIFELFNENKKTGSGSEGNFGLFYPNMTKVGGGLSSNSPLGTPPTNQPNGSTSNSRSNNDVSTFAPLLLVIIHFVVSTIFYPNYQP